LLPAHDDQENDKDSRNESPKAHFHSVDFFSDGSSARGRLTLRSSATVGLRFFAFPFIGGFYHSSVSRGILATSQRLELAGGKNMRLKAIYTVIGLSLLAFGWAVGRARTPAPAPEFTLTIEAPSGRTTITCVRGCRLQGGRDEGNPSNAPTTKYFLECSGVERCNATVNGWLKYSNPNTLQIGVTK
jgi:hypothetical protein